MVMHWRRKGGPGSNLHIAINSIGAVATGCTVAIVTIAKFAEGAWISVLIIPLLILLMRAVHRHYVRVAEETSLANIEIPPMPPPVAVLPISICNIASQAALQFACLLTPDVHVLHIECPNEHGETTSGDWQRQLDAAALRNGKPAPRVVSVASPYRFITSPILRYLKEVQSRFPDRIIAVVIPELVARHWYQYLLHNHRSTALKGLLLIHGDKRIVVINVPWYLSA